MITANQACDGIRPYLALLGREWLLSGTDEAYSFMKAGDLACCVVVIPNADYVDVLIYPSFQLPGMRACRERFAEFMYQAEDERWMDFRLDENDGELFIIAPTDPDPDAVEAAISDRLGFLEAAFGELVAYVRRCVGKAA